MQAPHLLPHDVFEAIEAIQLGPGTPAAATALVAAYIQGQNRMGSSEPHSEETKAIIRSARKEYACDDVEIDDVPCVSHADDGTWVMGWLWVEEKETADAI